MANLKQMDSMFQVDPKTILAGSKAFRAYEKRDAMYKVATFLVHHFWGKPHDMADALGVLLLTWNNALYRYGLFDFDALETTLKKNMDILASFRKREILSFNDNDKKAIEELFIEFLDALKIADGKKKGVRSPVAVAKALHLLAPAFFPLWDDKIAKGYRCRYASAPDKKYLTFMTISKDMAEHIQGKVHTGGTTVLKMIDEYNYAKFTKQWS